MRYIWIFIHNMFVNINKTTKLYDVMFGREFVIFVLTRSIGCDIIFVEDK